MKYKLSNQLGFTVLEISLASVLVFLITGISLYTVNRVQNNESDRSDSAQQQPKDEKAEIKTSETEKSEEVKVPEEQKKVEEKPKTTTEKSTETAKKETQSEYKSLSVSLAEAQITTDSVKFSTSWAGSYSGTCYLTVKNLTTSTYVSKELAVNGSNCSFSVAKTELGTGSFKYYISFKNLEHTVKGQSDYKTFSL